MALASFSVHWILFDIPNRGWVYRFLFDRMDGTIPRHFGGSYRSGTHGEIIRLFFFSRCVHSILRNWKIENWSIYFFFFQIFIWTSTHIHAGMWADGEVATNPIIWTICISLKTSLNSNHNKDTIAVHLPVMHRLYTRENNTHWSQILKKCASLNMKDFVVMFFFNHWN